MTRWVDRKKPAPQYLQPQIRHAAHARSKLMREQRERDGARIINADNDFRVSVLAIENILLADYVQHIILKLSVQDPVRTNSQFWSSLILAFV